MLSRPNWDRCYVLLINSPPVLMPILGSGRPNGQVLGQSKPNLNCTRAIHVDRNLNWVFSRWGKRSGFVIDVRVLLHIPALQTANYCFKTWEWLALTQMGPMRSGRVLSQTWCRVKYSAKPVELLYFIFWVSRLLDLEDSFRETATVSLSVKYSKLLPV